MSDIQDLAEPPARRPAPLALESRPLLTLRADLHPARDLGRTPLGRRRVHEVRGGRIEGRVGGTLLPSGADWLLEDAEGGLRLDARLILELEDGALACMTCQGRIRIPAEVGPLPAGHGAAAAIDPSRYYMRATPLFETSSRRYGWLNHVVAVGVGRITKTGVAYRVHEIL